MDDLRDYAGRLARIVLALGFALAIATATAFGCTTLRLGEATGARDWFVMFTVSGAFGFAFALALAVQAHIAKRRWLDARVERIAKLGRARTGELARIVLAALAAGSIARLWWWGGCVMADVARVPRDDPFAYWHRGSPAWSAIALGTGVASVAMFGLVLLGARRISRQDTLPRARIGRRRHGATR